MIAFAVYNPVGMHRLMRSVSHQFHFRLSVIVHADVYRIAAGVVRNAHCCMKMASLVVGLSHHHVLQNGLLKKIVRNEACKILFPIVA